MKCDNDPTAENLNNLEILHTEYDRQIWLYIAQRAMIRSPVNWYEEGVKSNKYFLNLESSKKKRVALERFACM